MGEVDTNIGGQLREDIQSTNSTILSEYKLSFIAGSVEKGGEYEIQFLKSDKLQLRFLQEQDSIELCIARSNAPRIWSDNDDGVVWWYNFYLLIGYEDTVHPEASFKSPPRVSQGPVTIRDTLNGYAALLEAYLPRLMQPFSTNPPPGWWAGFDAYCAA